MSDALGLDALVCAGCAYQAEYYYSGQLSRGKANDKGSRVVLNIDYSRLPSSANPDYSFALVAVDSDMYTMLAHDPDFGNNRIT